MTSFKLEIIIKILPTNRKQCNGINATQDHHKKSVTRRWVIDLFLNKNYALLRYRAKYHSTKNYS